MINEHIGHEEALKRLKEARNLAIAELFWENKVGSNPYVTDKNGRWLTNEELYEKLKNGDKE